MSGSVLAVIADTHFGSNTSVSPLKFEVHNRSTLEAQVTEANKLQRWLYGCWTDYWEFIDSLVGKGKKKKRLIVAHLGDVCDGNHHGSTQIVQEVGDQVKIALDMLAPIREKASTFVGILGTMPSHAGMDHVTETQVYRELDADFIEQTITLDIDGKWIDLAHHGRAGLRPWTSSAASLGAEVMLDYAMQGKSLPDYVFRADRHIFDDSGMKFPNTRVIQVSSWQLKTSFGWRVSSNTTRSDIGGIAVKNGEIDLSRSRYVGQPDARKVVRC